MLLKNISIFLVAEILPSIVVGHSTLNYIWTRPGDIASADGKCVRRGFVQQVPGSIDSLDVWSVGAWRTTTSTTVIPPLTSSELACGNNGSMPVQYYCEVEAGQSVSVEWHDNTTMKPDPRDAPRMGPSISNHNGPILHYMAGPLPEGSVAKNLDLTSLTWFKIAEESYDAAKKQWAIPKWVQEAQKITQAPFWNEYRVKLPDDLPSGEYLFRSELIALHLANRCSETQRALSYSMLQMYPRCAQFKVKGQPKKEGWDYSPQTKFPGAYHPGEPGIFIDVYNASQDFSKYKIPGPQVATLREGKPDIFLAKAPNPDVVVQGCTCPRKSGQPAECY